MPVWLTEDEFETLAVACDRLLPPSDARPVPSPPACPTTSTGSSVPSASIRRGSGPAAPSRAATGVRPSFARFHRLGALDELAWRMRIEGSRGLPEREFNGPVIGLQERYRQGLAALGDDFRDARSRGPGPATAIARPTSPTCSSGTPARACTVPPSTAATATASGWACHRVRRGRAAPGVDRRRGVGPVTVDAVIVGSGPGGATAADVLTAAGWSVAIIEKGRNHLLDPEDLTPAGLRLLQRRDQVPHPALPRSRPVGRAPHLPRRRR